VSIASNAEQFKQSFREEGREVLVDLEAALLELNENRTDQELVGRVFRALHTIKGSGAMFGFEELAAFTHHLETAFDEVRNGRLPVGSELIDLTLAALDQIRVMLEERQGEADAVVRAGILSKARRLAGVAEPAAIADHPSESAGYARGAGAPAASAPRAGAGGPHFRQWAIRFAPGPDLLLNGTNPLLLLSELRALGGLAVKASMELIPPLQELDPERCYVAWEMVLAAAVDRDAVRDVFIFVEDSCELVIEEAAVEAVAHVSDAEAEPAAVHDAIARGLEEPRASSGGRRTYDKPDTASSLRVPAAKLDQFVDLRCARTR